MSDKVKKSKISNSDFLSKNIICLPIFYDLKKNDIKNKQHGSRF